MADDPAGRGALVLPDGARVRGRGRRAPFPDGPPPDFGLYPGLPRRRETWRPDWPADWLDWPDLRSPRDPAAAVAAIVDLHARARAGQFVEVACGGGTGRTGTVIACLARLAGVPAADAVAWTREHYRRRAVETPAQRRWVRRFPVPRPPSAEPGPASAAPAPPGPAPPAP